jgi:hypothetical protein
MKNNIIYSRNWALAHDFCDVGEDNSSVGLGISRDF